MDTENTRVLAHPFAEIPFYFFLLGMVLLQMFDHLELLLRLVTAEAAEERVFVGVNEIVMPQARRPPETTVTHIADVWLLFTMLF